MCLKIDSFYHKDYKPLTYNKDIEVKKVLSKENNQICTYCFKHPVQFHYGKAELTASEFSKSYSCISFGYPYNDSVNIEKGIHSFRVSAYFLTKKPYLLFRAIIPKETPFYIGQNVDIASLKLIIFKNQLVYAWYCLIHGVPVKSNSILLKILELRNVSYN